MYSTALHSTTTESDSITGEPKIKKEGPVNNDNIAGLYRVQFMIGLVCTCKHEHKGFADIYAQSPRVEARGLRAYISSKYIHTYTDAHVTCYN